MNAALPNLDHLLRVVLQQEIADFFALEAELLDARRYEEWLDLLDPEIRYWMPIARNVAFGHEARELTRERQDLNWFDEGKFELEQRVKQILTGEHWAEEPQSRTMHLVANVRVLRSDEMAAETSARFIVHRSRTETESDFFVGKRYDTIARNGESWRIVRRKIVLDQNVLTAKNLTVLF